MSTILIGIAGGTGSGKTTLTRHLKEHNYLFELHPTC